jgi:hypothetical protein
MWWLQQDTMLDCKVRGCGHRWRGRMRVRKRSLTHPERFWALRKSPPDWLAGCAKQRQAPITHHHLDCAPLSVSQGFRRLTLSNSYRLPARPPVQAGAARALPSTGFSGPGCRDPRRRARLAHHCTADRGLVRRRRTARAGSRAGPRRRRAHPAAGATGANAGLAGPGPDA